MSEIADITPLASFEAKWATAHPEFGLALKFVAEDRRRVHSAFACLVYELEHAAFAIRAAESAMIKLQWWAEEFARVGNGAACHPLTRALAAHAPFAALPLARWHEVIVGAMAQRDPEPAADRTVLLQGYAALYRPLASIEATLFPLASPESIAHVRTAARALRETAALADALRDGRLPLPLDLLARHRLARGELTRNSPQQVSALREWLAALALDHVQAVDSETGLGVLAAANASADLWRAQVAARADDPLVALNAAFARVPLRAVWAAWLAGRRSRR